MKRMSLIAILIAAVATFAVSAEINTVTTTKLANGGKLITVTQLVTGTSTVTSPAFTLDGFVENTSTYPIAVCYSLDTSNQTSGVEVDSIASVLEYTNDPDPKTGTYLVGDTLSLTLGTTAYTSTTMDLNSKKGGYWHVKSTGKGANTAAIFKFQIYLYRLDH